MNEKITLPNLINLLALRSGDSKKIAEDFIKEFFQTIAAELENGEQVKIKSLGVFKTVTVGARKSVNVSTGKEVEIPSHKKVVFTPSKEVAALVNEPFEIFESEELSSDFILDEEEGDLINEQETAPAPENEEAPTLEQETIPIIEPETPASAETTESNKQETTPVISQEAIEDPEHEEINEFEEKQPASTPRRFGVGFAAGFICAALICAIIIFLLYFNYIKFDLSSLGLTDKTARTEVPGATENSKVSNRIDAPVKNITQDEAVESEKPENADTDIAVPTEASDAVEYDTITKTRYLTTMAKDHYGNYHLWPYIYMENQKFLGHPDRIKPGTKIVIPRLSKYGVDPKNPKDIEIAKKKGIEIYSRFQ